MAQHLLNFDFIRLFNELGWDQLRVGLEKEVGGQLYTLQPIAIKKGVQVLRCAPGTDGKMPPYAVRQKIERKVTPDAREHLIIFTDAAQTHQIWQWVARAPGRPTQYREVKWQQGQATELLEQKLQAIAFDLNEEKSLTVFGVAERLRGGFDRDTITKKFYTRFKDQRDAFQKFIEGISNYDHARWYTSVVIDRLMFLWFLQEKFFLNGEKRYLRNRLDAHLVSGLGESFYKVFLSQLFSRGFAEERTVANRAVIFAKFGNIPYLNGGLFAEHELEREYVETIDIPDAAFAVLFEFFDTWDWHLDTRVRSEADIRASGKKGEINPDVLGYIFEKFVNEKENPKGAFYTKEDITEYIGKNTIIPCLFDKVRADHTTAFDAHALPLLQEDPRRYIYPAMLHGIDEAYPPEIKAGLDTKLPGLLERRKPWNKPAAPRYALSKETWRECITRHNRTREVLAKLETGEVRTVADLVTYNLNIRQFAQDVIERCTDPDLLRAFWVALAGRLPRRSNEKFRHGMSVLDPTCGSGAFLFAGLQVLKPLYQACLTAMGGLLADEAIQGRPLGGKWQDIEETVERFYATGTDRECDYAVLKHIIVHNLYGVDIEAQATEIAKLRLFLKLVALLEPGDDIEPLPDIDFNIRAGNTLVGYASAAETERAVMGAEQQNLFTSAWDDIRIRLTAVEQTYNNFQIQQVQRGGHVTPEDKQTLRNQLTELEETLNGHLYREYEGDKNPKKRTPYAAWKYSHKPFHWYVDFYPIMAAGGFDVVIGNPPYVEYKDVKETYTVRGFETLSCTDLYAFCTERALCLLKAKGQLGLIVPISIFGTDGFQPLQKLSLGALDPAWISCFSNRPSQLFDGAQKRLTILVGCHSPAIQPNVFTTSYLRWRQQEFGNLFDSRIQYAPLHPNFAVFPASLEKLGSQLEVGIFNRITSIRNKLAMVISENTRYRVYYTRKFGYFLAFLDFVPEVTEISSGRRVPPSELKDLGLPSDESVEAVVAALSSSTFFWFWNVLSDCRNLNRRDLLAFPFNPEQVAPEVLQNLAGCGSRYLEELRKTSRVMTKSGLKIQTFDYSKCKPILDEIDQILANYYGLTDEELDYIINYDIKYRMGLNGAEVDTDD